MPPFYVARLLTSLDPVTGGRVAFNVTAATRGADAANYGFDELMEHDLRYERMEEFIDVCKALWDSVPPGSFVWDRESGVVCDPAKVHAINHGGRFFKVRGPLNVVPSPQGQPVLIQAGASPRGIKASAHFAEHVFGAGGAPVKVNVAHRPALDAQLQAQGRDPESVGILWGASLIVGETEQDALARRERLLQMIPPEGGGPDLPHMIGHAFPRR